MPDAPTPLEQLQALQQAPLLGDGLARAQALVVALSEALAARPHPVLEAAVAVALGELARVQGSPDAVPTLARAARLAEALDPQAGLTARLKVGRGLVAAGRPAVAERILREANGRAPLPDAAETERLLLQLDLGRGDQSALLAGLLKRLPSPSRDHDRLECLRRLSRLWLDGGDRHQGEELLRQALGLAQRHRDAALQCELSMELAWLHLEGGDGQAAEELLVPCIDLARQRDDTLALVALGSVLAGLRLSRGDWPGAQEAAALEAHAATTRSHWLAVADAAISTAAALEGAGDDAAAVGHLVSQGGRLRAQGAVAAVNLVTGRLGEMRATMGAERFDALLWRG